jgi:hypothetical protein
MMPAQCKWTVVSVDAGSVLYVHGPQVRWQRAQWVGALEDPVIWDRDTIAGYVN